MDSELLYVLVNLSVLPAWVLMIVAPRWIWTERIVYRVWIPALFSLVWLAIFVFKPAAPEGAGIGSLEQFGIYVSTPYTALQIWVQLLVWDLFVGIWVAQDALKNTIPHRWVVPCLLGTFAFPPLGLLLYFTVRFALRRTLSLRLV